MDKPSSSKKTAAKESTAKKAAPKRKLATIKPTASKTTAAKTASSKSSSASAKTTTKPPTGAASQPHSAPLSATERRRHTQGIFRDLEQEEEFVSSIDMTKVRAGVKRHILTILIFAVLFAGGAWGVGKYLSQTFVADTYIVYSDDKPEQIAGTYNLTRYSLPTVVEMMKLPVHFRSVKSILGLNYSIDDIMEMTNVEMPRGRSNLVKITCRTDNPNLATDIANTLAQVVVKDSSDMGRGQLKSAYDYFKAQISGAETRIKSHDQALADFKGENPHFELDTGQSTLIEETAKVQAEFAHSSLAYNSLLVEYENLKREASRVPEHTVRYAYEESPLKDRIAQTEMALLEARTRYASDNPKIKILETSLKELRKMLGEVSMDDTQGKVYEKNPLKEQLSIELMRFQGKLRSAQKLKEDLSGQLEEVQAELETLPAEQLQFAKLIHKKTVAEEELSFMEEAMRSAEMLMNLGEGDLSVYHAADEAKAIASKWDRLLPFFPVFGAIAGMFFGIGVGFLIEAMDKKLLTSKQVEVAFNVPCLQVIPNVRRLAKSDSEEELLYFTRGLFERLELLSKGTGFQSITFTSSTDGEGKSALAFSMARYLQRRVGEKVVYVSFDPQKNVFLPKEQSSPRSTVEQFLRGEVPLAEIVLKGDVDVILAGFEPNMKELIKDEGMDDLWAQLQKTYDRIVIDAPGVVNEDFVSNLSRLTDHTVFMVSSGQTKRHYIDSSLRELEANEVVPSGIVLNKVPRTYITDVRLRQERKRTKQLRKRSARAAQAKKVAVKNKK